MSINDDLVVLLAQMRRNWQHMTTQIDELERLIKDDINHRASAVALLRKQLESCHGRS